MQKLDFLNQAPKFSIFNNASNKTQFGGVLFLLEIIAIIAVIFIFLYNHKTIERYEIEYSYNFANSKNVYFDPGDKRFNSKFNFSFDITENGYSKSLGDSFIIRYLSSNIDKQGPEIKLNENFEKEPSNMRIGIYYKCQNETYCKPEKNTKAQYHYLLKTSYDDSVINFQGNIPCYKIGDKANYDSPFIFDTPTKTILHWTNIKFINEIGMWSRFFFYTLGGKEIESYTMGYIDSSRTFPIEIENPYEHYLTHYEKLLAIVEIDFDIRNYIEYRRLEKSIWATIANICALISTINVIFSVAYSYYSKNFDNYQMIKYIESKIENTINLNKKNIKNNDLDLKDINKLNEEKEKEKGEGKEKDENKIPLVNRENNDKEEYQLDNIDDDIEKIVGAKNDFKFWDFLLNNVYSKCCQRKKKQELINICNEIVIKYLSAENIIYNQIMMEKLLKDYKWNNRIDNNIIFDNDLFIKYKNIS